ncbi:MAG: hypothetical protein ABL958_14160 [Bdellovibrionia bacterium]
MKRLMTMTLTLALASFAMAACNNNKRPSFKPGEVKPTEKAGNGLFLSIAGIPDSTENTSVTFTFEVKDKKEDATARKLEEIKFTCKLDAAEAKECKSGESITGLSVASHTFTVTAADIKTPTKNVTGTKTFEVTKKVADTSGTGSGDGDGDVDGDGDGDGTGSGGGTTAGDLTVDVTSITPNPTTEKTATLKVEVKDKNVSKSNSDYKLDCKLNTAAAAKCPDDLKFELVEGPNTIEVKATDKSDDKKSATKKLTITVTKPAAVGGDPLSTQVQVSELGITEPPPVRPMGGGDVSEVQAAAQITNETPAQVEARLAREAATAAAAAAARNGGEGTARTGGSNPPAPTTVTRDGGTPAAVTPAATETAAARERSAQQALANQQRLAEQQAEALRLREEAARGNATKGISSLWIERNQVGNNSARSFNITLKVGYSDGSRANFEGLISKTELVDGANGIHDSVANTIPKRGGGNDVKRNADVVCQATTCQDMLFTFTPDGATEPVGIHVSYSYLTVREGLGNNGADFIHFKQFGGWKLVTLREFRVQGGKSTFTISIGHDLHLVGRLDGGRQFLQVGGSQAPHMREVRVTEGTQNSLRLDFLLQDKEAHFIFTPQSARKLNLIAPRAN